MSLLVQSREGMSCVITADAGPLLELDATEWVTRVRAMLADLKEHIAAEKYDLFPASWQMLSSSGWERVGARMDEIDGAVTKTG